MLDCVGPIGVKRLKAEHRRQIPGVLGFCRNVFEQQVPFDYEFRLDDSAALLPRAHREGVPVAGTGPVEAGPDRRLGAPGQLSADGARGTGLTALTLDQPITPGSARLLARQRTPGGVGLAPAGDGLRPGTEV